MSKYAKAIVAAVIAGLGGLATASADSGITLHEAIVAALDFVIAGGAVFQTPNKP